MNARYKELITDKIVLGSILGGIILCVFHLLFLVLFLSKLPIFLPLFNQLPWGEARLATKTESFIPLGIAVVVLASNAIGALFLYQKMPLVSRFLCVTSLLVSVFSFVIIIRTILIVL